ncbi:MAG: hypothetical protein QW717_06110 [Candidatus Bathyarchaeia archaeon]
MTKDEVSFIRKNYERVKNQHGVSQDIFVISAKPVPVQNNIVISTCQTLPLPIRIGLSLKSALKTINLYEYSHIFKIDGDVILPLDYLHNLLAKKTPVAGRGAALLISTHFFKKRLSLNYPVTYCDDGYIAALSISLGCWPPEYDGQGCLEIPPIVHFTEREYFYGFEYYKWGVPFTLLMLLLLVNFVKTRRNYFLFSVAGYISALVKREKKYEWWRNYARVRTGHFIKRLLHHFRL